MNNIIRAGLTAQPVPEFAAIGLEAYQREISVGLLEVSRYKQRLEKLQTIKYKLKATGGINRSIVMESWHLVPGLQQETIPLNYFTKEISSTRFAYALEAVDTAEKSLMDHIRALIAKMVELTKNLFGRIQSYLEHFFSIESQNRRSLDETQKLLTMAKQKETGKGAIAQEGFQTGSLQIQAPHFLHIEYSKIISETQHLETLAKTYISETLKLLGHQFRYCEAVINAYQKLTAARIPDLAGFERYMEHIAQDSENVYRESGSRHSAFDCIEILEDINGGKNAGVLKFRVSIKPPSQQDLVQEPGHFTTNLMKAQDLHDRLVELNKEIVRYATEIKEFFVQNSKIFLDTLTKLNSSMASAPGANFTTHSDYVNEVHSYLVRGNLVQVVVGLNVLNSVWKAVHTLNTRVVKEFIRA